MIGFKHLGLVVALSASSLAAASAPSRAATGFPYGGVGQHRTVMNNIYRAQQRNDAAISHVQTSIRSSRPRTQ